MNEEIILYGADWCPDCRRAKSFLKENNIDYTFIDVDLDKDATNLVETINNGKRIIPTLIINGKSHTNPDNAALAAVLGINNSARIVLFGADWCPDCRRAKAFLADNKVNYQFIDVDEHQWATDKVEEINNGKRIIPTILIDDIPYSNPDNYLLKEVLKLDEVREEKMYDSIIIGGGAAGLTTAIYAQRDRFDTLILEKRTIGGNAYLTEKIENYPGFTSISGPVLMERMEEQATFYGATIKTGEEVVAIHKHNNHFHIKTKYNEYKGRTVVLSTGSTYKKLGIPGEDELIGSNVHFCATCDGAFYKEKEIIVIGGGNTALEEGIFLSGIAKKVTIVNKNKAFEASQTYIDKLETTTNIDVLSNKESVAFELDENGRFDGLKIKDISSGEVSVLKADGVFIFIGLKPNTTAFKDLIKLNEKGFIETSGLAQTSVQGIFAAGDSRSGAIAQVAAATGEGVLASYGIRNYLK